MNRNTTMRLSALRKRLKLTMAAVLLGICQASAQSILLPDPAGDGGFENGSDFASNGRTVENYTGNVQFNTTK